MATNPYQDCIPEDLTDIPELARENWISHFMTTDLNQEIRDMVAYCRYVASLRRDAIYICGLLFSSIMQQIALSSQNKPNFSGNTPETAADRINGALDGSNGSITFENSSDPGSFNLSASPQVMDQFKAAMARRFLLLVANGILIPVSPNNTIIYPDQGWEVNDSKILEDCELLQKNHRLLSPTFFQKITHDNSDLFNLLHSGPTGNHWFAINPAIRPHGGTSDDDDYTPYDGGGPNGGVMLEIPQKVKVRVR